MALHTTLKTADHKSHHELFSRFISETFFIITDGLLGRIIDPKNVLHWRIRMKRMLAVLSIGFILYIIYFDLTTGTLPQTPSSNEPTIPVNQPKMKGNLGYIEITMKPGDTLLSIIEREEGAINQPIEAIISDFQELNEGLKPEQMQIGKTYKIPKY